MKKYPAITCACMLAALALPAFAACSKDTGTEALVPPEEIIEPLAPSEEEPNIEEVIPSETEPETPVAIPEKKPAVAEYVKITTDNLNVRKGAGTNYASLGTVEKNILMKYAGKSGSWYETRYMGQTAFVHADHAQIVTLETGNEQTEKIIEEGLNVLGTPYVYGATRLHDGKGNLISGFTTKKFDCSSLMQFMFYRGAGILLNMNTRTQITQGKAVTDELKRGDLMFFTNASRKNNTGIERVGHVALYLGNNYILHTASDYAKIEQISQTRWSYYLGARRMG
ncbi:MAG: hypothetical protein HDP28_01285 [Clostridia bacterium]|nr:hypothetical protein [Clostridia bacterium]